MECCEKGSDNDLEVMKNILQNDPKKLIIFVNEKINVINKLIIQGF